jgi:hypothetical protein
MTSACMIAEVPMSHTIGSPVEGKAKHIGLVPNTPSAPPCGATQGPAWALIIATSPSRATISA